MELYKIDNLSWEEVDGEQLQSIIEGLTVCGAEPIDYPLTDGAIIYLTGKGKLIALELGTNYEAANENGLYIKIANIPDEEGEA